MAEFCEELESMGDAHQDVEFLVRAAGHYVRPSDDLRPRVLENARIERRERRAQRYIRHAAVCVILLVSLAAALHSHGSRVGSVPHLGWLADNANVSFMPAQATALRSGDLAWQMVESLTELRRQQAQALGNSP